MSAWIGLTGVILGSLISGIMSFLINKQNHKNALEVQTLTFNLENKRLYAEKHEELMSDFLKLLSLSDEALQLHADGMALMGLPSSLKEEIDSIKNSSVVKARLYFPEIIKNQDEFLKKYVNYIDAIEKGSEQLTETYGYPLQEARDNYMDTLSTQLKPSALLANP